MTEKTIPPEREDSATLSPDEYQIYHNDAHATSWARQADLENPESGNVESRNRNSQSRFQYPPKQRSWQIRPRSPGLKWYKDYDSSTKKIGRVLVIDFVKWGLSKEGTRKVAAQEIDCIERLRKVYSNVCASTSWELPTSANVGQPVRGTEAVLRVFHVQNAPWATNFLLRKFNINARNDLVGSDFGRYVKYKRPERRGGKPFLSGKAWETQHDPWRSISKTGFGIDYLKPYRAHNPDISCSKDNNCKLMEINCFDAEDNPAYSWDVYVQRLSCYIQHKEVALQIPTDLDIENPYIEDPRIERDPHEYIPRLETLDNGNAIIIFENSHSGSIYDTMISARQQWESRWRRLPFYLAYDAHDVSTDERMALQCMKMVVQDIWKSAAESWDTFLDISNTHISILEDKIYEEPADESRAPELWTNSSIWLKVERLMLTHVDVIRQCQLNLRELSDDSTVGDVWLEAAPGDFERLNDRVQEDLVKPTANLADLMYKSVGIRDSRHSLQLSMSMWRLSWITFIFLPLTFIVGFFGMNVDTFSKDPSIKWYFVSVFPMMLAVLISWYVLKHYLEQSRQTPYSRGIYEHLFQELATNYPLLWSRSGPRDLIVPRGRLARWKWWFILRWSAPDRTIKSGSPDGEDQFDGLGTWSRLKRHWLRTWTAELYHTDQSDSSNISAYSGATNSVPDGIGQATQVLTTAGADYLEGGLLKVPLDLDQRMASFVSVPSAGRPSSQGSSGGRNSGIMVEEELPNWLLPKGDGRQ